MQLYEAGHETWRYGQAEAAEEEDGQADDTQGKKKKKFFVLCVCGFFFVFCFYKIPLPQNKIFCSRGLYDDHKRRTTNHVGLKRLIVLAVILEQRKEKSCRVAVKNNFYAGEVLITVTHSTLHTKTRTSC